MQKNICVSTDMQYDFVYGCFGTPEAKKIVPDVVKFLTSFDGDIISTRDTHYSNYLKTSEGRKDHLPVPHCIYGTKGWNVIDEVTDVLMNRGLINPHTFVDKNGFGTVDWEKILEDLGVTKFNANGFTEINVHLIGLCTDVCVNSLAITLKALFQKWEYDNNANTSGVELNVIVHKDLCAGITPKSHEAALVSMASCQIAIV